MVLEKRKKIMDIITKYNMKLRFKTEIERKQEKGNDGGSDRKKRS